ncbi:MAG TPA: hypothetical protein VFW94_04485 [Candidatus Acidoferrales bacterium]|nr:hypothetical protein [Candidatus Acidoferrales bacterium]
MIKTAYFGEFRGPGWPTAEQLAPYFFAGQQPPWTFKGRNDNWGLDAKGLYGTETLPDLDRVNVHLSMTGHPAKGVMIQYRKWDGTIRKAETFYSGGDLTQRLRFINSVHGTPLSLGLFIPFGAAWRAVKEFIETDGELPKAIDWIAGRDLPDDTFPDMGDREAMKKIRYVNPME